MQKVSKQSLAMIALSILLAISIALTFTFAAWSDSKTAKGTITFVAGGYLSWVDENTQTDESLVSVTSDGNVTVKLTDRHFSMDESGTSATLNQATKTYLANCRWVFRNDSNSIMRTKITLNNELGSDNTYEGLYTTETNWTTVEAKNERKVYATSLFGGLSITNQTTPNGIKGFSDKSFTYTAQFTFAEK